MNVRLYVGAALAVAVGLAASPAAAQDRLVHQELDRNTSALVRVYKTPDGGRIEVETPQLKITKAVAGQRVVTRMSERGDELVVAMDEKALVVSSPAGKLSAARTDRARLEQARLVVAGSSVGRKAADLIGRMGFGAATPIQPMLITTRAFILAATGDNSGGGEMSRWVREARARATSGAAVVRVSWTKEEQDGVGKGMTPTDCWNAYTKEAIAAYMEYEECMKDTKWWDLLSQAGCATIYDMRAIGAFSWWLKCVALN